MQIIKIIIRLIEKMNVLELSEQEIVRRQSLQELRNMGINPYPAAEFPTKNLKKTRNAKS